MDIVISGHQLHLTEDLKDYAQDRAAKLGRYFQGLTRIRVMLSKEAKGYRAEMVVSARKGVQLVCQEDNPELHAALDLVTDKMERQLTRFKEKLHDHRSDPRHSELPAVSEENEPSEEQTPPEAPEAENETGTGA